jgi:hypothetical protein
MSCGQDVPKEKRGVFLVASTANDERFGSVGDHAPRFVSKRPYVRLAGGWYLFVPREKIPLTGCCWWLVCSEGKILLAGG